MFKKGGGKYFLGINHSFLRRMIMILKYKGKYNPLTALTGSPYLQLLCSKELELGFFG